MEEGEEGGTEEKKEKQREGRETEAASAEGQTERGELEEKGDW